ncbi:hypothetical protein Taro_033714 [Colocasia esculenta]|uniref:Uncharacterized protein n=1 Tax=Colocasia esculenta TaxID=4460 RepID=A0A843VUI8_COLES|nr:hypothetical protein [Colocasia esculenta]
MLDFDRWSRFFVSRYAGKEDDDRHRHEERNIIDENFRPTSHWIGLILSKKLTGREEMIFQ